MNTELRLHRDEFSDMKGPEIKGTIRERVERIWKSLESREDKILMTVSLVKEAQHEAVNDFISAFLRDR